MQREARGHFGCPTLPGLEIENQGGTATAGSHWEKRITEVGGCVLCVGVWCVWCVCVYHSVVLPVPQNEAMTGQITQNPAFSRLTLAVLEDSGYRAE